MDFFIKIFTFLTSWVKSFFPKTAQDTLSRRNSIRVSSHYLKRTVTLDLYLPDTQNQIWSLLLINDGQDGHRLGLDKIHRNFAERTDASLMMVGIHAENRMQEYGTAGQLSDKGLGKYAQAYQDFIIKELLPYLHRRFPITAAPDKVGIAGFSLGGLSAIDLGWSWPSVFGIVGVFSGALWWREKTFDPLAPDANRIMHKRVQSAEMRKQRIWMMAGTEDETADRNDNGIIDAIDDTLQLQSLLNEKIHAPKQNIHFLEVEGGKHDPQTWGQVFPDFLDWAYVDNQL